MERLKVLMSEWAVLDGYPQASKSLSALNQATKDDQCQLRVQFFESLLRQQSLQSDGWLKFFCEDFEPTVKLDAILDPTHPDNQREGLVQQVARLAEEMVKEWLNMWIVKAEQGEHLEWRGICWDVGSG